MIRKKRVEIKERGTCRRGLGFYIKRAFPLDESELDKVRGVTKGNCTRERERKRIELFPC